MEGSIDNLPDEIIENLKQKAIERTGDDGDNDENNIEEELLDSNYSDEREPIPIMEEPPVNQAKKPKKERSEKQKAAFEKARKTRAENLKIKKELEAEKKEQKQKQKEEIKKQVQERVQQQKEPAPVSKVRFQKEEPRYREQVVNNYYYYGDPRVQGSAQLQRHPMYIPDGEEEFESVQEPSPPVKKRGRNKKPPPPVESSEEESEEEYEYGEAEEPESYKELQSHQDIDREPVYQEPAHPKLKFRFA